MIGESIFSQLEALMQKRGVLSEPDGRRVRRFAQRGSHLGPLVERYLLGKEASMNDLMSWNADGTRMP
jgi:polyhydroxyalkanoate synthase